MLGPTPRRTTLSARPVAGVLVSAALVAGALTGCSGDPEQGSAATPTSASVAAAATTPPATRPAAVAEPTMRTKVRGGQVTGRLPMKKRKSSVKEIAAVADTWFDEAYVAGDYPRNNFETAFRAFTAGATRTARGDRDLMTNADLGNRIEAVKVKRRDVTVDLLAVGGRARAATARVHLAFTTSGVERRVRVTGRLFLTQNNERWRVFGYDVAKGRS